MEDMFLEDTRKEPTEIEISAVVRIIVPNNMNANMSTIELQSILSDYIDTDKVDISNIDWEYPY